MDRAVSAMTTYARGVSSDEVRIMLAAQLFEQSILIGGCAADIILGVRYSTTG